MYVRSELADGRTDEYGGAFRRLYPWDGVATPPWGSAYMTVGAGEHSVAHAHDEEETFLFLSGEGLMHVDAETRPVIAGDVVYLPRFSKHFVENTGTEKLDFLCVWWGAPETAGETS